MRGYLRITKLLLGLAFRKGLPGKRSPRTMLAGSIIASAILSACIAVGMGFIGAAIADLGSPSLTAIVMGYLILGDFMLTLVFGTLTIMSYLYFSRDSEFFLSLPVGSNAVLCSKLTVIYIEEALVSAILVLPGSVVLGAVTGQTAMFYVVALIAVPTFDLARSAKINIANCWIPVAGALAIWAFGVSPILIILIAAVGGYVYGKYIKPTEQ